MSVISVVIPVFNGEKTIVETVNSVLNQTFTDLELVVVNDGSRDATLERLATVNDDRLQVFSYANAGVAMSRNRGFSHTSGEYIAFLDADDLWTPDKLEAQFNALQEHPEAAVAYSWVDYITSSGDFFRHGNHLSLTGNVYETMLIQNLLENGSNPLIRRDALEAIGEFNSNFQPTEDWDLWLRLAARYSFVVVPKPQILYRMSTSSASANVLRMEKAVLAFLEQAFQQAPQHLQHLKKKSLTTFYYYLTFKTLEAPAKRQNGLTAMRFYWNAVNNDRSSFLQWKTTLKALFKVFVVLSLPPERSQAFMKTTKQVLTKYSSV